jgi:deferrochelatase/peroxidase EfeB
METAMTAQAQAQVRAQAEPPVAAVELDDIQGLLRFGYGRHPEACFLLLRISDRRAARGWLAQAPVSSAATAEAPPGTALQVALTCEGLQAIGVAADVVEAFSAEFVSGLGGNPSRSRRLGDAGASDPAHWRWGAGDRVPHVLVMLYAARGALEAFRRSVQAQCAAGFEQIACLGTSDMDGVEPFGFIDGISQPEVDWKRERAVRDEDRLDYANLSCLGEFVLGYPNEYGLYTDRPLLDRQRAPDGLLPPAEDAPQRADLGRNGSYLVMRQLRQDVRGFWQFLDRQAGGDAALRRRWAEAMVGRTLEGGAPLVGETGEAIAGAGNPSPGSGPGNAFTYRFDPQGLRCPLGAHIRRANPRNADLPAGSRSLLGRLVRILGFDAQAREADLIASTRFHRLLRRGREYGSQLPLSQALAEGASDGEERGLHFVCLGANIGRQFEFVQAAWLMAPKFAGLAGESDPLLGRRLPGRDGARTDVYSMPQPAGPDRRLPGLPEFVAVLGGAYFFLPGIRALRWLATAGSAGTPAGTEQP